MSDVTLVMPDGDPSWHRELTRPEHAAIWDRWGGLRVDPTDCRSATDYVRSIGLARAALIVGPMPSGVLSSCPRLELVALLGVGVSKYVDLKEAHDHGITIVNTPNYGDVAVAEHTMALMLAALRHVTRAHQSLEEGVWLENLQGREICGMTVGLVGLGGIGAHVARLLHGFGANVVAWTRSPDRHRGSQHRVEFLELADLMRRSEVVSLHASSNDFTRGMITRDLLAAMRVGALLVNTARAELVDGVALAAELRSGRLSAALDVFDSEPIGVAHELLGLPNVLLTPHCGYNTPEAVQRMVSIAAGNVDAYFSGAPRNVVRP